MMRDGIRLATDVYGSTAEMRRPTLLIRTPYNKGGARVPRNGLSQPATWQSRRIPAELTLPKEIRALQQRRSGGFDTIHDGPATLVKWESRHVGSSHPGAIQWVAAADRAPGLVAVAPTAAPSSLYHPFIRAVRSAWASRPARVSSSIRRPQGSLRHKTSPHFTTTCRSRHWIRPSAGQCRG